MTGGFRLPLENGSPIRGCTAAGLSVKTSVLSVRGGSLIESSTIGGMCERLAMDGGDDGGERALAAAEGVGMFLTGSSARCQVPELSLSNGEFVSFTLSLSVNTHCGTSSVGFVGLLASMLNSGHSWCSCLGFRRSATISAKGRGWDCDDFGSIFDGSYGVYFALNTLQDGR